mmetsp:Transcript_15305/g.47814  ORF Transcript_15305/g.47814 Transcript_15305/m.47814 type:complete len:441 (+) Transcript_15305:184-1506(+)
MSAQAAAELHEGLRGPMYCDAGRTSQAARRLRLQTPLLGEDGEEQSVPGAAACSARASYSRGPSGSSREATAWPRAGSTSSSASPSTSLPRRWSRCSRGARGRRRRTLHGGRVVGARVLHGDHRHDGDRVGRGHRRHRRRRRLQLDDHRRPDLHLCRPDPRHHQVPGAARLLLLHPLHHPPLPLRPRRKDSLVRVPPPPPRLRVLRLLDDPEPQDCKGHAQPRRLPQDTDGRLHRRRRAPRQGGRGEGGQEGGQGGGRRRGRPAQAQGGRCRLHPHGVRRERRGRGQVLRRFGRARGLAGQQRQALLHPDPLLHAAQLQVVCCLPQEHVRLQVHRQGPKGLLVAAHHRLQAVDAGVDARQVQVLVHVELRRVGRLDLHPHHVRAHLHHARRLHPQHPGHRDGHHRALLRHLRPRLALLHHRRAQGRGRHGHRKRARLKHL